MDDESRWGDMSFLSPHDMRSSQYCFVKFSGDKAVYVCDTSGEKYIGILQNHPVSGDIARVRVLGRSKVKAAKTVKPGYFAKTNHSGMALSWASGDWYMAMAIERATAGRETLVSVCHPPRTHQ